MGMYQLFISNNQIVMAVQGGLYPVYKQLGGENYIYVGENGYWRVSKGLKYTTNDPTPPSPPSNGWRYWDNGWKDDQTVQLFPARKKISLPIGPPSL